MKSSKTLYVLASVITIFVLTISQFSAALAQDPTPTPTATPTATPTPTPPLACPTSLPDGVVCTVLPNGVIKFEVTSFVCDIGDNNVAEVLLNTYSSGHTTYFMADYLLMETSNYDANVAMTKLKYWRFDGVEVTPPGTVVVLGSMGKTAQVNNGGYLETYPDMGVPASVARIKVVVGADWPLTGCSITGTFYISTSPIQICNEVVVVETNTYNIDPIIEFPQGPTPVPPAVADEQIAYPEIGTTYRIRTAGQWDNGSAVIRGPEWNAFSYSFDGITWANLQTLPRLCMDSDGLTWTATESQFHIRVDDTDEDFADNLEIEELTYTLESVTTLTQCGSMFSYDPEDDWLASGQINSASWTVHNPAATIVTGDWYALETAGQPWNYQGTDRFDIMVTAPPDNGLYASEFSVWPYTQCWEYTGTLEHKRYYFQAPGAGLSLWANLAVLGTGQIGYNLYHVEFTYIPANCENQWGLNEKFIDNDILYATSDVGYTLNPILDPDPGLLPDWVIGNYYMLETKGGPWSDAMPTRVSWDILISSQDGAAGTWASPSEWTDAVCVAQLDPVGHMRIYFRYTGAAQRFKIRVDDDDFPGNTGTMNFDVWKAADLGPGDGNCDDHFDVYPEVMEQDVPPNSESGTTVFQIVAESTYMLETKGWWQEGELDFSSAAISDNNGATWYPWDEYPERLCFETFMVDTHVYYRLYFKAAAGRFYKVRALDIDQVFSNNVNSGDFGIRLQLATNTDDPFEQCNNTWELTVIKEGLKIPANIAEGVKVDTQPGKNYAIEITGGSWQDGGTGAALYDAAISPGNVPFSPWYAFNDKDMPGWQCVVHIGLEPYARVYFTASQLPGNFTEISVNEGGTAIFFNNTGELTYTLYSAVDIDNPIDDPGDGSGYAGCNASILRPSFVPFTPTDSTDILEVIVVFFENVGRWFKYLGGWFPYLGNSFMTFFLWCPEHDAIVSAMRNTLAGKEPFTTALKFQIFVQAVKSRFDSYSWDIGANAPMVPFMDSENSLSTMFSGQGENAPINPYAGGQLVWDPSVFATGEATIRTASGPRVLRMDSCDAHVTYTFGSSGLVVGFCVVMNLIKMIGFDVWLNMFLMVACLILFFRYFGAEFMVVFNFSRLLGAPGNSGSEE